MGFIEALVWAALAVGWIQIVDGCEESGFMLGMGAEAHDDLAYVCQIINEAKRAMGVPL